MKKAGPPRLATWVLEHFYPRHHRRELIGDMFEQFQEGRTSAWYWQQSLYALWLGMLREIRGHRLALVFAIVWAAVARLSWALAFGFVARGSEGLWHISYPGSLFFAMQAVVCVFLWIGVGVYALLFSLVVRTHRLERVSRGLWIGPFVFLLTSVPAMGLAVPLLRGDHLIRLLPYFIATIAAVWPMKVRTLHTSTCRASR